MSDDRPRTPWIVWLFVGVAAVFTLRVAVHAVRRVVDLASIVLVVVVLGVVGGKVALGGRRGRHRD
jgi:hypothetical protein